RRGGSRASLPPLSLHDALPIYSPALDVLPTRAYAGGLDFFRRWGSKTYSLAGSVGASYIGGDPAAIRQAQRSSNRYYQRPDASRDRKSTRLNSSHDQNSYAVFC